MASVMEIKSEVFAGFYEGIDVSVLIRVEGIFFVHLNYPEFIG